jgi:hypothetical protein
LKEKETKIHQRLFCLFRHQALATDGMLSWLIMILHCIVWQL